VNFSFDVPLFIPGSGSLLPGPILGDFILFDTASDNGSSMVNGMADLILPAIIPRGVPFTGKLLLTIRTSQIADGEEFLGSRSVEQALTNVPEPSAMFLVLSGLAVVISKKKCFHYQGSRT